MDWFNQVDATYRTDLRALNELNFARFDAKLEQRVAQMEARFDRLEARIDHQFAEQNERLEKTLVNFRAEMIKWMFLFFVASALSIIGLASRILG